MTYTSQNAAAQDMMFNPWTHPANEASFHEAYRMYEQLVKAQQIYPRTSPPENRKEPTEFRNRNLKLLLCP